MPAYTLEGVTISAGGQRIQGFGETDALSYKRAADDFEPVDCCDGATIHNRILTRRGEITITLRYDSTANAVLNGLADGADSFEFTANFPNGRVVESGECRVLKRPEPTFGGKTSDEVWVLSAVPLAVQYELGS